MQRLFLSNIEIDLGQKKISQTYQINDLAELKDRNLHFTNRFNVPASPTNMKAMQYLGVIGSKSRKPYERIPAKYEYDGIELMPTGFARVTKANEGGFDINIYDGNASLYETLKGRRMNELDYEDLNHALNGTIHLASMDHTSGYIYALGDFGVSTVTGIINSERQVAALYKHTLFEKIMTEAGFTYEGSIFSNIEFLREVVIPTKGYDVVGEETTEAAKGSSASNTISKNEYALKDPEYEEEQFTQTGSGLVGISVQSGDIIQFDVAGLYRVNFTLDWSLATGDCNVRARFNGSYGSGFNMPIGSGTELFEMYIQAEVGDEVVMEAVHHAWPGAANKFEIEFTAQVDATYTLVTGGLIVKFEDIMPDSSQIDFIKDVMQQYGLIFQANKNTNHYVFMMMEDLLNDRSNAENWSDKLINNGDESYSIGSYAQNNRMLYKYTDQEVIDASFDGNMTADHANLKEEKTLFASHYTISEKTQTRNGEPIYGVWLWELKEEQEGDVINNKEVPFRSFKINLVDTVVTYKFGDIVGNYSRNTDVPFLSLENMGYGFYIITYYNAFQRILDDQKKRTVKMFLKTADIYNLDFLRLKYIKQLGQYFYLNKVRNFTESKQTKVELIQANELTVNQPPSQLGLTTKTMNHNGWGRLYLSDFINTDPIYTDPEFDQPETIRITSGYGAEVIMKVNGVEVTNLTPFDVDGMYIEVEDQGTDPLAHSVDFDFTIQSFNNPNFSSQSGTITININAEQNLRPIADAGSNTSMPYDSSGGPQDEVLSISGAGSSDPNNDALTYLWEADQLLPSITLSNATSETCTLTGIGLTEIESGFVITMTLTVKDPSLLSDSDTMLVTLIDLDNPPE